MSQPRPRIAIIGGGPGGYEAALVAAQLGAEAIVAETDGLGGACVLTDCVPSKTLIETAGTMSALNGSGDLGIRIGDGRGQPPGAAADGPQSRPPPVRAMVDAPRLYSRVKALAKAQSADVAVRLAAEGVEVVSESRAADRPADGRRRRPGDHRGRRAHRDRRAAADTARRGA